MEHNDSKLWVNLSRLTIQLWGRRKAMWRCATPTEIQNDIVPIIGTPSLGLNASAHACGSNTRVKPFALHQLPIESAVTRILHIYGNNIIRCAHN